MKVFRNKKLPYQNQLKMPDYDEGFLRKNCDGECKLYQKIQHHSPSKFLPKIRSQSLAFLAGFGIYAFKLSLIFTVLFLNFPTTSYAALDHGVGRLRTCTASNGNVSVEGLDFNPTTGGKDIEFVMTNPVCDTLASVSYATVKGLIFTMNKICGTGSKTRFTPSPALDLIDIAKSTKQAYQKKSIPCAAAIFAASTSLSAVLGEFGIVYAAAKTAYNNTAICGAEWMKPNSVYYNYSTPYYKQTVKNIVESWIQSNQTSKLTLSNAETTDARIYREWYYGGVEIEDSPDDGEEACYDVTQAKVNNTYPLQKYYLKGTETGNFNCKKYLILPGQNDPLNNQTISAQRLEEMNQAYNCCKKRSQEYICINYNGSKKFCRGGTRCDMINNGLLMSFSAKFIDDGRLVCAESYSACPYNFTVSGGTEYCDYYRDGKWDEKQERWIMITPEQIAAGECSGNSEIRNQDCTYNNKANKCKNYCQYLTHCTETSGDSFRYNSNIVSPYFSEACLNFKGDSQNKTSVQGGFILGSQKHFSAPIAQCIKESLENLFYNRAGHSKCLNYNESPSANGICPSGQYALTEDGFEHKKGNQVKTRSFFTMIQDNLQLAVKMALTLSIVFYGMNLLLLKANLGSKKDIMIYILKIGLIMYFATGDAWQSTFFKGVYGASSEFALMVFKIEAQQSELRRDGCQFGKISLPDGTQVSSGITYPSGKEYLAIWDTLDCKIMRYLGFGPEMSEANIASLILASFFTGAIGIYFSLSILIFGILLIAATIRALHIFLASALSIIIMVFISPIIIPLVLFEKTKSIFDNWLKELISFCLQPMILFAYIAIFVTIMDRTFIGSAYFSGQAPSKAINCLPRCVNADGSEDPYVNGQVPTCQGTGQIIVNPLNDSVACLINANDFGSWPGFSIIGVGIPIMINLLSSNVKERILTIFKGALVMYLIYKFMDQIPGITSNLIGGKGLPKSSADGADMLKKVLRTARAIQKRAGGATKKLAKKSGSAARDMVQDAAAKAGNKGKGVSDAKDEGSGSHATNSGNEEPGSHATNAAADDGGSGPGTHAETTKQ